MATRVLILMTKSATLSLLDGTAHPSGYWAEEFAVPYERFVGRGFTVDLATSQGDPPSVDRSSLDPQTVQYTRPADSEADDAAAIAHYRQVIASAPQLDKPLNIGDITKEQLAGYDGVYISGGHGAMEDMPHDQAVTRVVRWILELEKPLASVCHGQSALLPLRDSEGRWPLAGYQMTAFSHDEELVTAMSGRLPFVLQVELERLGARYQKAPVIWGSCVVEDRNLITGQNPHSSAAIAEALITRLS